MNTPCPHLCVSLQLLPGLHKLDVIAHALGGPKNAGVLGDGAAIAGGCKTWHNMCLTTKKAY